jgi:hypothetical protein
VERFDIPTQTWSTVASLPNARSDLAAMSHGGKIYVVGGCVREADGSITFLDDVDVYNPRTNTWSTAPADMPTARAAMYGVGWKGGRIFVIGGWAGGGPLDTNEFFRSSLVPFRGRRVAWSRLPRRAEPRHAAEWH